MHFLLRVQCTKLLHYELSEPHNLDQLRYTLWPRTRGRRSAYPRLPNPVPHFIEEFYPSLLEHLGHLGGIGSVNVLSMTERVLLDFFQVRCIEQSS